MSESIRLIEELSLEELESVIEEFPWFSIAVKEEFSRLSRSSNDRVDGKRLKMAAIRMNSRSELFNIARNPFIPEGDRQIIIESVTIDSNISDTEPASETANGNTESIDFTPGENDDNNDARENRTPAHQYRRTVIIGGDYFSKEDLEQVRTEDIPAVPHQRAKQRPAEKFSDVITFDINASDSFNDEQFYTETLAEIYVEQGLSDRAIEVYSKLILLYPEKNSYFAGLIDKLKSKK